MWEGGGGGGGGVEGGGVKVAAHAMHVDTFFSFVFGKHFYLQLVSQNISMHCYSSLEYFVL